MKDIVNKNILKQEADELTAIVAEATKSQKEKMKWVSVGMLAQRKLDEQKKPA